MDNYINAINIYIQQQMNRCEFRRILNYTHTHDNNTGMILTKSRALYVNDTLTNLLFKNAVGDDDDAQSPKMQHTFNCIIIISIAQCAVFFIYCQSRARNVTYRQKYFGKM